MKDMRFGQNLRVVPLLIAESAGGVTESQYVNLSKSHWCSLLVGIGDVDSATTITIEQSSASDTTSATELAFFYRLSGAASAGSDTWGDITSAATTGYAWAATDIGKFMQIEIDPRSMTAGKPYVHVLLSQTSVSGVTPAISVVAFLESRYNQYHDISDT